LEPGYSESKQSWAEVLSQLKAQGVNSIRLFVGDGNLGLWAAVGEVYPQAEQQLCCNHKMLNVMNAVSQTEQPEVKKS
jgi:transposase-like protein